MDVKFSDMLAALKAQEQRTHSENQAAQQSVEDQRAAFLWHYLDLRDAMIAPLMRRLKESLKAEGFFVDLRHLPPAPGEHSEAYSHGLFVTRKAMVEYQRRPCLEVGPVTLSSRVVVRLRDPASTLPNADYYTLSEFHEDVVRQKALQLVHLLLHG
jgi:hypothetical protein